jgi:integrase
MVFRYAVNTGRAERDPSMDLLGALTAPQVNHRATIVDPKSIGALLRAIDGFDGQPTTHAALRLAAYLFVRPGELRHAEWKEFDLDAEVWTIPAENMKMRRLWKNSARRRHLVRSDALASNQRRIFCLRGERAAGEDCARPISRTLTFVQKRYHEANQRMVLGPATQLLPNLLPVGCCRNS